jgi:hypothetical protein
MAKNNFTQITTPKGKAYYPHLRTTEVFDGKDSGKYACGIKLSPEESEKLMARIENEWEMAKKTPELDGKKFQRNSHPHLGYTEDNEGEIVFKAKTNAVIKTKDGEVIEKSVPVFDKYGKPMAADIEIGHGSTIRLCILLRPFYASAAIYGVQLLLKAVQVLEYVAPSMGSVNPDDCGFDCLASDEEANSVPFADDSDADF